MSDRQLHRLMVLLRQRAEVYDAEGFSDRYFELSDLIRKVKDE